MSRGATWPRAIAPGQSLGAQLQAEQHSSRHEECRGFDHAHEEPGSYCSGMANGVARDQSRAHAIDRTEAKLPRPFETVACTAQHEGSIRLDELHRKAWSAAERNLVAHLQPLKLW